MAGSTAKNPKRAAMSFIVTMGMVSLFADASYEGARSILGAYMARLGAKPVVVGVVVGGGELLGYLARAGFGPLADRTRRYWLLTGAGYIVNLLSIPAMALARSWALLAGLVVSERFGKALRTPARDAMLSKATRLVGEGWGFGVHEALDQIGAVAGPLGLALVLASGASYRTGFLWLSIPVALALIALGVARKLAASEEDSEADTANSMAMAVEVGKDCGRSTEELEAPKGSSLAQDQSLARDLRAPGEASVPMRALIRGSFGVYLLATAFSAAGLADFALIAYHAEQKHVVSSASIPLVFAAAMAVDGASALGFGRLFDKIGLKALCLAVVLSAPFAVAAFARDSRLFVSGVLLWGIGLGAQESIMRSGVATLTPQRLRGSAYGLFGAVFGISWFLGSALMGYLYGISMVALVVFSVMCESIAASIIAAVWISKGVNRGPLRP